VAAELQGELEAVRKYIRHWEQLFLDGEVLSLRPSSPGSKQSRGKRKLVPSTLRLELFKRVHQQEAGHSSYDRVHAMLASRFWWWGMSEDLTEWLKACGVCQRLKPGMGKGRLPLKQELAGAPLERVAIDIMGRWPMSSSGNEYVLVLQDYFSKWVEIWPLPKHDAATVARALVTQVFSKYGAPARLHSDQGREFESRLFAELCKLWRIDKTRTAPYTPWSDGMVERVNRSIQAMLKPHLEAHREDWDQWLWAVAQAYNATVHASTGQTPYKLFLSRGSDPVLPLDLIYGTRPQLDMLCPVGYLEQMQHAARLAFAQAHIQLGVKAKVQATMFERGGLKIRTYSPGQKVWRFYPPLANLKLRGDWTGPWEVLEQYNNNTVKIGPLAHGRLLPQKQLVVHTSCVKPVSFTRDGQILLISGDGEAA